VDGQDRVGGLVTMEVLEQLVSTEAAGGESP
jgi:hypothetical protein